jgi:hypothetical protein
VQQIQDIRSFIKWIESFRIGNIDSFLNFITVDSLEIDDADADPGKDSLKYSRSMLRQQLTRRKGAAFPYHVFYKQNG